MFAMCMFNMFFQVTATVTGVIAQSLQLVAKTIDPDKNNLLNKVFAENKTDTLPYL